MQWRRRAALEDRALKAPDVPAGLVPLSPDLVTDPHGRTALALADVWACIRVLADSISTLPVSVYRDTENGRQPVGPDSTIQRLLAHPAPGQTLCDLLAAVVTSMCVHGEAFVGKYGADGRIAQLGVIDPSAVSVRLRGEQIVYTIMSPSGVVDVGPADLLHIKAALTSADGLRGLSPIATCRMALGVSAGLAASAKSFLDSGSRPSGILTVKGAQSEYTTRTIGEQWNAGHGGPAGAGRVAVLTGEATFTPLGLTQSDAEFIEQRELSTREICRIFNVPPWTIGGSSANSLTYSTVAEQARAFVMHSLRPIIGRIEAAFDADATLCPGGVNIRFELDYLLRAAPVERANFYTAALNPETGWLSRSEVRAAEGLEPDTDTEGVSE